MVTSEKVTVTLVSHKSEAVGATNSGAAGQSIGVTCVAQVIVGAMVSCTTMVALHVAVLRQSSVAVQVLVTL